MFESLKIPVLLFINDSHMNYSENHAIWKYAKLEQNNYKKKSKIYIK